MVDLARSGVTMVVVTHEMSFARGVCDEVVLLEGGEIVERGPPAEVMSSPRSAQARQFFGTATFEGGRVA